MILSEVGARLFIPCTIQRNSKVKNPNLVQRNKKIVDEKNKQITQAVRDIVKQKFPSDCSSFYDSKKKKNIGEINEGTTYRNG